jgi:flagellin FlaB
MKQDNAFTGLEAAIVLIAFVVVAAIFSYVMLGAGFFATQKAQEVTYASIKQATSNVIPDGSIYGETDSNGEKVNTLYFSLTVPVSGQPQEFSDLLVTYSEEKIPVPVNVKYGSVLQIHKNECTIGVPPGETVVPPGNTCTMSLDLSSIDDSDLNSPGGSTWFQLEIKPPPGAPTTLQKIIPTGYKGGRI